MSHDELVRRIQRAYPRIWYHCHTHHPGRGDALSERESQVLSHLQASGEVAPAELATHLRVAASTLSEAVDKLVKRALVDRRVDPEDRRRVAYRLTAAGHEALDTSSVLSGVRLGEALARLGSDDRERAVQGLELIAGACVPDEEPS